MQVIQMMRTEAYRLAGWQLLVTFLIAAAMGFMGGSSWAVSAVAGGCIGLVTNLWQALRMARVAGSAPEGFLGGLYLSELIKAVLTVALFIFAIKVFQVELVPTISAFGACFIVHLATVRQNFLPADPAVLEANRQAREERARLGLVDDDRDEI